MKKLLIIFFMSGVLSVLTFSQIADMPEINMEYLLSSWTRFFYPQGDYIINPGVLLEIDDRTIKSDTILALYNDHTKLKHTISYAGGGNASGEQMINTGDFNLYEDLSFFFPEDDRLWGVQGIIDLAPDWDVRKSDNFNADPEDVVVEENSFDLSLMGRGFLARPLGDRGDLGLYGDLYYLFNSREPEWTTDLSVDGGTPDATFTSMENQYSTHTIRPGFTGGVVMRREDRIIGLSADLDVEFSTSMRFTEVDKDGAGVNEDTVSYLDWSTTTEAWGRAGGPYPDYKWRDMVLDTSLDLNAFYIINRDDNSRLIGTLLLNAIRYTRDESFERFAATEKNTDLIETINSGLTLTLGLEKKFSRSFTLRYGGGSVINFTFQRDNSLDAAGDSVFDTANTHHYPEVNWANHPNNNLVSNQVNTGTDSYDLWEITPFGAVTCQWTPADQVLLFSSAVLSHQFSIQSNRVYNLADNTIWIEREIDGNSSLDLELLLGAGIYLDSHKFLGIKARNQSSDWNFDGDSLPFVGGGGESTGGQGGYNDLLYQDTLDFSLEIFFIMTR